MVSLGITFVVHTFIDGDVREIITFTKTINALPHALTSSSFIPTSFFIFFCVFTYFFLRVEG